MPYESNFSDILARGQRPEELLQKDFGFLDGESLGVGEDGRSHLSICIRALDVYVTLCCCSVNFR